MQFEGVAGERMLIYQGQTSELTMDAAGTKLQFTNADFDWARDFVNSQSIPGVGLGRHGCYHLW
jgi:hypothetical protein